jgi:hypothetical protein
LLVIGYLGIGYWVFVIAPGGFVGRRLNVQGATRAMAKWPMANQQIANNK